MYVWQHLNDMDHLRRCAEGKINVANGPRAVSAAATGHRPNAQDAHRLDLKDGMQSTPGLVDLSGPDIN